MIKISIIDSFKIAIFGMSAVFIVLIFLSLLISLIVKIIELFNISNKRVKPNYKDEIYSKNPIKEEQENMNNELTKYKLNVNGKLYDVEVENLQ